MQVNQAYAPLQAIVTSNGVPVGSGVSVTFTVVPATGDNPASGTFSGATPTTDTETTNASGVATTSQTLTANGNAGGFTVVASIPGSTSQATFSLTNTAVPTFAFYLSGLEVADTDENPYFYALAGAVAIDVNGNVIGGEQDYNDGNGILSTGDASTPFTPDSITGGTLAVDATGQGQLTLTTTGTFANGTTSEILGVQFVNANHALITQFDGTATSSGSLDLQNLASAPGTMGPGFAFTLSGVDSAHMPVVFGGVFTFNSDGNAVSGVFDVDDSGAVNTDQNFSGTVTPTTGDLYGRGTVTGTTAPIPTTLVYYNVGPEAIRLIDVDAGDSAIGSAFGQGSSGPQSYNGFGSFSNTSLVPSVFGVASNSIGYLYAAAGSFTTDGAGTIVSGIADDDEEGAVVSGAAITGSYNVNLNGYGYLTIDTEELGDVSALGIYMIDPLLNPLDPNNYPGTGGALIADLDGDTLNGTGVLVPQTDTTPADFTGNTGSYAFGGQDFYDSGFWEFDFVGQGSFTSGAFTGTGLVSDPGSSFAGDIAANTGVAFSGTPLADADESDTGRYTMLSTNTVPNPLAVTVVDTPVDFNVVIYQASGSQLFWMSEDTGDLFLGPIELQGTLTGVPGVSAAKRGAAKTKLQHKK